MNTPYVTTKELAELLPFSLRHLSERVTHRRDFPAYSTTSSTDGAKKEVTPCGLAALSSSFLVRSQLLYLSDNCSL